MQHARNRLMWRTDAGITVRFLIRDADTQFCDKFDDIWMN
jgi:hypothetical protein